MIEQPSKRVIQALATLQSDPDFQEVKEWLTLSLDTIKRDALQTKDEVHTRWYQGAGQVLEQFLTKVATARETLRKF